MQADYDWKQSPCPILRQIEPIPGDPEARVKHDDLKEYLRNELGVSRWVVALMIRHARNISDKQGLAPADLQKSFVLDPVFSGVTRNGTHLEILEFYYRSLDPSGEPGERSISTANLPRFSAILRQLFPKKGFLSFYNFHRSVALFATTLEWHWLIRVFGEKINGKVVLSECAHRDVVLGQRPQGKLNRACGLTQVLPALWKMFRGLFVRLDKNTQAEILEIRKRFATQNTYQATENDGNRRNP